MINFHVEIFLWSGANTKIYQHENLFTCIEKWSITKRISVFAAFTGVLQHLGGGCCLSPYVSAISGAVAIICASFLPLP